MDPRTGMPRVGMVGGGQLARMTQQAAIGLGQTLRVLAVSADDSAALVTPELEIGIHTDLVALRSFAQGCEVVTFDHEHVPTEHIRTLASEGHAMYPGADALEHAQDKGVMRRKLRAMGLPVPPFSVIPADANSELTHKATEEFAAAHGWPVVLKTCRGGYDGRGVWILKDSAHAAAVLTHLGSAGDLLVETLVPLDRELAAVVARSPFGQAAAWPVVETVQQQGICVEVIAPAQNLDDARAVAAQELALSIAASLGVVGVLAVELFEVAPSAQFPGGLVINELAMRPHNSGHWSIDGAITSQFEQHLRAVLDYPLGKTDAVFPVMVMGNVIGGSLDSPGAGMGMDERIHHLAARFPAVKVHLYGKSFRPGRKLGHVNVGGSDLAVTRRTAQLAALWLSDGVWGDGYAIHGPADDASDSPQHQRGTDRGAR
ncbi:5-(carboxyamino)imidazole ribonucleotide synthase [Nakamurella antarctica]|uniref:N5-carboxyaminoimidazole ribonucleotide synthase n=1 Tax=Nakamurella antarctica TaxID=1902245 RepID=A0A3G8ZMR6_9ACTN|nr:5-(carboxyamino)imidazole ribonucleotide synthase [Nakamurella antarctica]AZI58540.1 5-(carboxyamino)imidazole ribonucleotide synthase [Nakamurella antarctica]